MRVAEHRTSLLAISSRSPQKKKAISSRMLLLAILQSFLVILIHLQAHIVATLFGNIFKVHGFQLQFSRIITEHLPAPLDLSVLCIEISANGFSPPSATWWQSRKS
jgi:hypothetical protein